MAAGWDWRPVLEESEDPTLRKSGEGWGTPAPAELSVISDELC